uniref:Uncharacterized protein n=1 Tax=Magallana gigas TaxID=29159 RepID=A0A8W8K8N4_MAGGI
VLVTDGGTVSTLDVCLSTLQSLGPISITDSAYCDSVLCLVGQGVQFDDVSLMELEDVLEQKLLERWNSCGSAEKDVESAPENAGANTDSRENLENVASRQNMAFFPICIVFVCTRNYLN